MTKSPVYGMKSAAEQNLADMDGKTPEFALALAQAAQAQATLYLAEQQRVANRIALAQLAHTFWPTMVYGSPVGTQHRIWDNPEHETDRCPLTPDIRDALEL